MKRIISILLILICAGTSLSVSAMKVSIPFDYDVSPPGVHAQADNGVVSVEVCRGGIIKTTDLANNQTQILKHICYEDIYWIKLINDEFIAFSDNYMLSSGDGYNWNVAKDDRDKSLHEQYNVGTRPGKYINEEKSNPDFETVDSEYKRDDGKIVHVKILYTGQEWLKFEDVPFNLGDIDDNGAERTSGDFDRTIYKSSDRQNWEYIDKRESNYKKFKSGENSENIPFPGFRYDADIQILNTGNEYLVRSTVCDYYERRERTVNYYMVSGVFVYDHDLKPVKAINLDDYIVDMAYLDGVYYLTSDKNITYKSTDLENWEILGENMGCPMRNSVSTIYKTRIDLKDRFEESMGYYEGTITSNNGLFGKNVVEEGIMLFNTRKYGDFYVSFDAYHDKIDSYASNDNIKGLDGNPLDIFRDSPLYQNQYISFSKDGVYWATLDIPMPYHIHHLDQTSDSLLIKCNYDDFDRFVNIKYSDMESVVPQSNVYIELNNRILGFSQPPVMESDRILVPMRFLFEQMGAEVNWNDETQTAIAISARGGGGERNRAGENTVTFSIDNTTAYVNGAEITMDVPARLINDQTFVPLRFLSENLGYTVEWDEAANTAIITTE